MEAPIPSLEKEEISQTISIEEDHVNYPLHLNSKGNIIFFNLQYNSTNYKKKTAKSYLTLLISVFRHFEITVERLPYFSTVSAIESTPIDPDLLVDREILKLCIGVKNPLLKAVVLFMSSSG